MHACMHAYMHTYIHKYIHTYIHTYIHICIHIYIYICMCVCLFVYLFSQSFIHSFMYLFICLFMYLFMYFVYVFVCMCTHAFVYTYTLLYTHAQTCVYSWFINFLPCVGNSCVSSFALRRSCAAHVLAFCRFSCDAASLHHAAGCATAITSPGKCSCQSGAATSDSGFVRFDCGLGQGGRLLSKGIHYLLRGCSLFRGLRSCDRFRETFLKPFGD